MKLFYYNPRALLSTFCRSTFRPLLTCSSSDRQVAAESHEATAADAWGPTQLKCMCLLFQCQLHLCVTSQDLQISEGSKTTSTRAAVTRNAGGHQDEVMGCRPGTIRYSTFCISFVPCNTSCTLQARYESVWYCTWKNGQKQFLQARRKGERQHAHKSSPSWFFVCVSLAHTGDTANVLSRFLCGVSVLAQGSDLRGHGVLVMPPRLAVPVCPQSVCKQIKRRGLFN